MSAGLLGAAACLRRALPTAAVQTARFMRPASIVAGRRHAPSTTAAAFGTTSRAGGPDRPSDKGVQKQVDYIHDPWVLGKYIEDLLAKDKVDEALRTVEFASKKLEATVSWNHIIDHLLKKQQIRKAMATFNNMKKRAQFPNAQTFTIIFRGLVASEHPKNAVTEAIKIFHQMKNSRRLQPNTTHLNAVLSVCSRAYDMDHLFMVAAEFENLNLAPTAATYNIMLSGMRQYIFREYVGLDADDRRKNTEVMVGRAKNIWVEVLDKWRAGKIRLDEALVCSMGRLLLTSRARTEKLEVLHLLDETMGIPNLVASRSRQRAAAQGAESKETEVVVSSRARGTGGYVQPGQNTLGLLLTTLLTAQQSSVAPQYWNLLVQEKKVVPDNDNWLRMIGILKGSKSSAQAAQLLSTLPSSGVDVQPRSFRIAMEACVRDNINPNVMANATRILSTMQDRLGDEPDMHTMRLYLRVALVSHAAFRDRAASGDEVGAKAAYGLQIATALAELWEPYIALYNKYFKSDTAVATGKGGNKTAVMALYTNQKEVIALGRMMVGGFSKVVEERMLPGNNNRDMAVASAKINRGVQAFFADRELREPQLNKKAAPASRKDEDTKGEGAENSTDAVSTTPATSPFEIDMPELNDKTGPSPQAALRQGADFIWNTNKPMGAKKRTRRLPPNESAKGQTQNDNKSVIDRWVSAPVQGNLSISTDSSQDTNFTPIQPAEADGTSNTKKSSSKAMESGSALETSDSIWPTLMAQRNAQ